MKSLIIIWLIFISGCTTISKDSNIYYVLSCTDRVVSSYNIHEGLNSYSYEFNDIIKHIKKENCVLHKSKTHERNLPPTEVFK